MWDSFGVVLECAVCVLREAALLAVLTLVQCCWCCRLTDYRCGAAGLPERHQRIRGHRRHRAHRLVGLTSNFCEQSVVVERKGMRGGGGMVECSMNTHSFPHAHTHPRVYVRASPNCCLLLLSLCPQHSRSLQISTRCSCSVTAVPSALH